MTSPTLAYNVRGKGRHYPWQPADLTGYPLNRWGSFDPETVEQIRDQLDVTLLPSVTNILSVLGSGDGLLYWAGEEAVRAVYRGGWSDDVDKAVSKYKGAFDVARKKRAAEGTSVHTIVEALSSDLLLPASISATDEAYADGFLAFWADMSPEPLWPELTVYNPSAGYAGTADLVALIDGKITVVDYKTRKSGAKPTVYDKERLQLAALASASVGVHDGELLTMWSGVADNAASVLLFPDGTYHYEQVEDLAGWGAAFASLVDVWRQIKK